MLLNIPFYENKSDGKQCMQVAMQCVLKHFLNKEYSLEELDHLTKRKVDLWTWTPQIVSVLHDLGLNVHYYSATPLEPFLEGESFIRKQYGADADHVLKNTDVSAVVESAKRLMKYTCFEQRVLPFKEVEDALNRGIVPLMLIDYNKIKGKEGPYQGHFIVVTGFDENSVLFHESGPHNAEPNKRVVKQTFIDAWNARGTDNDIVLVFGKR